MFEFACHESNYGVFNVVKGAQTREDELFKQGLPLGRAGGGGDGVRCWDVTTGRELGWDWRCSRRPRSC